MSLGIAEVTLPISFKLSNIEETNESRRRIEAERQAKYRLRGQQNNSLNSGVADIPATGTARFWNPSMSQLVQQTEKDKVRMMESRVTISGPSVEGKGEFSNSGGNSQNGSDGKKRMRSSDDTAMSKFKNNVKNRK